MSSANNHKRHTLEEEFQRRLFDAEAKPAADLWARIDHDLTVQENKDYKKRVVFYRQLAAACFVLFAVTGALLAYHFSGELQQGQSVQGIAGLPKATDSPQQITPEAAMEAYMKQHAAPIAQAEVATSEEALPQPTLSSKPSGQKAGGQLSGAAVVLPQESTVGSYYNVAPGYSPYLGYGLGTTTGRGKGFVSGTGIASGAGLQPESGYFSQGNRYSQIITWESVTITIGNQAQPGVQAFQPNSNATARSKSFAEMSESYQTARKQKASSQAEALSSTLNKDQLAKAETQKANSRWSLNLAYAPSYFEQNISLSDPVPGSSSRNAYDLLGTRTSASVESFQNIAAARNEYEERTQPAFSYTVEAKAGFKLKEKLKLLTGIGYSESTARTKSNYIVRQFWVKPRTNERYEMGPSTILMAALNNGLSSDSISVARTGDAFATEYKYRHLTVPVGLQYEHDLSKDWFVYVAGGVAANFLLETVVTASNQDVKQVSYSGSDDDSPFRNIQLSVNASIGVGKRLTPNLTLALGPEVRNYFNTLVAEPERAIGTQGRPYAIGLNMGLNYQLGSGKK